MPDPNTGTSNSIEFGFSVEGRAVHPTIVDGVAVGPDWQPVNISYEPLTNGIAADPFRHSFLYHLLNYETAMAVAWSTLAKHPNKGLECRLVKYRLETKSELTRVGPVEQTVSAPFYSDIKIATEEHPAGAIPA